ncbi:unnamed protein product [Sphagnum jensenii]|uniref:Uncharacterized protein n=1 Tax=Sphagnum jensenii TaxID=128206 RepID=A0ABP0W060_9BRYO
MENRRSIAAIRSQVLQQPAVSPTKEGLFGGSGKKTAGAARNHTRKALADKTNESPTSSGFTPSPMKLKEGDRVSYKGTPYPKLLRDIQKATVPPPVLNKVETAEEYSLHRMPKTPGELVAPTPANTPISSILPVSSSSFSRRALPTTPSSVFTFAPPVFEDKPDVPMSPNQEEEEEEALNANKSKIKAEPIPANKPIVVSSSFDHSVLTTPDNRGDSSSSLLQQRRDSSNNDEIDEEGGFEEYNNYYEKEENDYEDYEDAGEELDGACDELCYAISQFTINEKDGVGLPISKGQHVRFNYNSDDEMEGEIVVSSESPSIVRLKGLPTPKGKHLRFTEEIAASPSV